MCMYYDRSSILLVGYLLFTALLCLCRLHCHFCCSHHYSTTGIADSPSPPAGWSLWLLCYM